MSREPLPGFTPWPDEFAAHYRSRGYWAGITLGDMLRESSRSHPERLALVCGARRWSYAEFDRRVDLLAAGLSRLGIMARDRVVVQLPNVAEFLVTCFALFRIGALPVFALPAHRRAEIGHSNRPKRATRVRSRLAAVDATTARRKADNVALFGEVTWRFADGRWTRGSSGPVQCQHLRPG